jgi:superfamily I DNA/RNA helicase
LKYSEIVGGFGDLKTLTPSDVVSLSEEEIMEIADSLSDECKVPVGVRCNLLKSIFKCVGYDLSNDLLLALLVETRQQLILAPAGGCKTTSSQIKVLLSKIMWKLEKGTNLTDTECLCLVYNRENKPQMLNKHSELLNKLLLYGFVSVNREDDLKSKKVFVNSSINASTMHSFANHWIAEYDSLLGVRGFKLLPQEQESSIINTAIRRLRSVYASETLNVKADKVKLSYDLVKGLMIPFEEVSLENPQLYEAIVSTGVNVEQLLVLFESYEKTKKFLHFFDYTDMLTLFQKLLSENSEVRERMWLLYPYVVVDEIQDFTPIMMSILQMLVGPGTKLLCIGDEDQSIYSFRGADIDNAIRFNEKFPDAKVFQLFMNRRCGNVILDAAKCVIEMNINRFSKQLSATRSGGSVVFLPYSNGNEMYQSLVEKVLSLSQSEQDDTVICMRDKVYGQPVTRALFDNGIPYHTFNVLRFENHEVVRTFIDIMNLLWSPSRENWRSMYKVVNVSKSDWFSYLGIDPLKSSVPSKKFPEAHVWWELDFAPFKHYRKLRETLNFLKKVSNDISRVSCESYLENVLELFVENYWLQRCYSDVVQFSDDAVSWIRDIFKKQIPYPVLYKGFSSSVDQLSRNEMNKLGVTVATFHSLKGLEFSNVFMCFLEDSIFPGFSFIESKGYSADAEVRLKEAENRLAYVAMTRAKNSLNLLYDRANPSLYVTKLISNGFDVERKVEESEGFVNKIVFSNKRAL